MARFTPARVERLLADPGIVRNRLKVESPVANARAFLDVQREFGSFDAYVWRFVGRNSRSADAGAAWATCPPARNDPTRISKDLKRRGFRFVGSTICYAFMQAVGMVNDHLVTCHRYAAA